MKVDLIHAYELKHDDFNKIKLTYEVNDMFFYLENLFYNLSEFIKSDRNNFDLMSEDKKIHISYNTDDTIEVSKND